MHMCGNIIRPKDSFCTEPREFLKRHSDKILYHLYSDECIVGYHTRMLNDEAGSYAEVLLDAVNCWDNETECYRCVDITIRLPECKITKIKSMDNSSSELNQRILQCRQICKILHRVRKDKKIILELARAVMSPSVNIAELNALRNKIHGKIIRSIILECPYCHELIDEEQIEFSVEAPISFLDARWQLWNI